MEVVIDQKGEETEKNKKGGEERERGGERGGKRFCRYGRIRE